MICFSKFSLISEKSSCSCFVKLKLALNCFLFNTLIRFKIFDTIKIIVDEEEAPNAEVTDPETNFNEPVIE